MEKNINNPLIPDKVYKNLPDILKIVTDNFSGRERDIVLTSSLGVLSSLIPNVFGYYDSSVTYPNLFSIISAPPASGKGVVMKARVLAEKTHAKVLADSINGWNKPESDDKKNDDDKEKVDNSPVLKIIPANISSSELYNAMNRAKDSVLIIESEADTMGNMLGNDWGNYSDVLRKSFHHEPVSMSRKSDGRYIFVQNPKLSIVLSGTPAQLKSIINSKENGLLSRFIVYCFDEVSDFKNVFEKRSDSINKILEAAADKVHQIYEVLKSRDSDIEFELTQRQQQIFLKYFTSKHHNILTNENESLGFISNIHRLGLIFFRICMILSVYRQSGNFEFLSKGTMLICSNQDFLICLKLMGVYYKHSLSNFKNIEQFGLSENDEELLGLLSEQFSTNDIYMACKKLGLGNRTIHYKLKKWRVNKIIKKLKNGVYQKL